jgi:hypothetical protein
MAYNFNYKYIVTNLVYLSIFFIFATSLLLTINSIYNLILISSDNDDNIINSDYNKYKSIRFLLRYKILMNNYTSTKDKYSDSYLTLNTNAFLLKLIFYISIIGFAIFVLTSILCYFFTLNATNMGTDIRGIIKNNLPLIISSMILWFVLVAFLFSQDKTVMRNYKTDVLEGKDTIEQKFIKKYLIHYDEQFYNSLINITPIKISDIKTAVKDKAAIFESILNKLKYLDKYTISNELTDAEIKTIKDYIQKKKTLDDITTNHASVQDKDIINNNIIIYCYYFTVINKDTDVDPVKLIYEFIKKVKQIILEDDTNKYENNSISGNIGIFFNELGDDFSFLFSKIFPTFLLEIFETKSITMNSNKLLDEKYENVLIESLYTCDYIKDNSENVNKIDEDMNKSKRQVKDILIAIVTVFIILIFLIICYFNWYYISIYNNWVYIYDLKKGPGSFLGSFSYYKRYISNLPKFNTIIKKDADE